MEKDESQVTRNIASARVRHGKTQELVAKGLKITERTYKNIENNPFSYSITKLNEVAKAIGCNIDEFFLPIKFTDSEN